MANNQEQPQQQKHRKYTVVGRFWKKDDGSFTGYIELGLIGRIDARMFFQDKEEINDCDLVATVPVEQTPIGILKALGIANKKENE